MPQHARHLSSPLASNQLKEAFGKLSCANSTACSSSLSLAGIQASAFLGHLVLLAQTPVRVYRERGPRAQGPLQVCRISLKHYDNLWRLVR